jgi:hypothetical protein
MAGEIVLPLGSSAEPDTCGSCRFFVRRGDNEYTSKHGFCNIKLPAKMVEQGTIRSMDPKDKDREYTGNEDQIKDTDRCDLYKFSGKVYVVQRRILPEKTG